MSIEVQPMGVRCNLSCSYCYQHPLRDGGNFGASYDLDKMKAALEQEGGRFTVFGGEALLMPIDDLRELLRWGHERFGGSSIQTNATLVTDAHVEMFRAYHVSVGISMDGPGALNDARWAGSIEKTRLMTAKSEQAITRLIEAGIVPSLIITLHRGNATGEALDHLLAWVQHLDAIGIRSARVHLLEVDHALVAERQAMTTAETVTALTRLAAVEPTLQGLRFDLFTDMRRRLASDLAVGSCVWHGCDPWTTPAVRAVDGQGSRANCGRTNKDGINWVKADQPSGVRTLALYHTPYAEGGCGGCRFFAMCQGHCPGTGLDGDWRNRSAQCEVLFAVFETIERSLVSEGTTPASLRDTTRQALEARVLATASGDRPHGDVPHGDAPHGDHTDAARVQQTR